METVLVSKFLAFLIVILYVFNLAKSQDNLCSRIYFKIADEDKMPYIQVEGVYQRLNTTVDGFPMFKHDERELYFHYSRKSSVLLFSTKGDESSYYGVSAKVSSSFNIGDIQDTVYPFKGLIMNWRVWNPRAKFNVLESNTDIVELVCVNKHFYKCSSDYLYFNTTITSDGVKVLNNITTDYFNQLSVFVNNRPVYKHNRNSQWFLFYQVGHWIVGPDYRQGSGYIKTKDTSLRPEYVTVPWEYHAGNGQWKYFQDFLGLQCKGVTNTTCLTNNNPCLHNGRCITNSINETVCRCSWNYHGPMCDSATIKCSSSITGLESGVLVSYIAGTLLSDLATIYCKSSYNPFFYFRQCTNGGWTQTSPGCTSNPVTSAPTHTTSNPVTSAPTHTKKTPQKTQASTIRPVPVPSRSPSNTISSKTNKPFNLDDHYWVEPVAISLIVLLQVFHIAIIPYIHYKKENDFMRWFSLQLFISVILWAIYLIGCRATVCGRYGKVFIDLVIMAFVVIPLGYIIILCESCLSAESEYISSMLQGESVGEFLNKLKRQEPNRQMGIECWHLEARTRTVYNTDANGNTQTRTETYYERVTTWTEQKTFEFRFWQDVSDPRGPQLDTYGVTRLKLSKEIGYGDDETFQEYFRQRQQMIDSNKHRDENCDFTSEDNIPGFEKRVCMYTDAEYKPWWMNSCCFCVATLLGLSWPYRGLFNWKTKKSEYEIKKEIFMRQPAETTNNAIRPVGVISIQDSPFSNHFQESSFQNPNSNSGPIAPPPGYSCYPGPATFDPVPPLTGGYGYDVPPNEPPPEYSVAVGQSMGATES